MQEDIEVFTLDLSLNGGSITLQIPVDQKEAVDKLIADPNFSGKIKDSKVVVIPSKDSDLNDVQITWNDFNAAPSTLSLFFDMDRDEVWKTLNANFDFESYDIIKKCEVFFNSNNEAIENSRFFVNIGKGLYVSFVELVTDTNETIINSLIFTYDGTLYDHDTLSDSLIKMFIKSIIVYEDNKDSKIYIANFTDEGFEFEPYDLGKIVLNLKGHKKKVYNEIVKSINTYKKGTYVLYGERGSGKTLYLKKLLKTIKKKIIYVPVDSFEYVFHNRSFFQQIQEFGDCLVVFEDCEMYFSNGMSTNIYLSILMKYNDSLISDQTNFNCVLILNTKSLNGICTDLSMNDKVSFVSMIDNDVEFNGYK